MGKSILCFSSSQIKNMAAKRGFFPPPRISLGSSKDCRRELKCNENSLIWLRGILAQQRDCCHLCPTGVGVSKGAAGQRDLHYFALERNGGPSSPSTSGKIHLHPPPRGMGMPVTGFDASRVLCRRERHLFVAIKSKELPFLYEENLSSLNPSFSDSSVGKMHA